MLRDVALDDVKADTIAMYTSIDGPANFPGR